MPAAPVHPDATVTAPERVLLIACGALAHEVLALKQLNGWSHMDLRCLPATLHNTPDQIPGAVRAAIRAGRETHDRVLVLYGDCGTGGALDRVLAEERVARIAGPHCYAFFSGTEDFVRAAEHEFTAFYLTDFLAKNFETMVIRPLGLDRHPELRDAYFGHYDRLIYLAQIEDPALEAKARAAAQRLGLDYVYRFTGYGDLATLLHEAA